jgi:thiol-disulfide isomerase/thioredoxin
MSVAPHPPAPVHSPSRARSFLYLLGFAALIGLGLYGVRALSSPPQFSGDDKGTEANKGKPADDPEPKGDGEGKRFMPAPELDGGIAWLNTAGPIHLKDLRGKIVVLDFWTLCCINCIHTLPDLKKIEEKYAKEVVVIGVHSAKFDNEKETESIRKAILRYEISHPVVNDANQRIWQAYGANSWPTLIVIDPEGNLYAKGSGEGLYDALDKTLADLIKVHKERKTLNEKPIKFQLARFQEKGDSPLFFPGKIVADAAGKRLFIADSTHHRIVITDLDGNKIAIAGTGQSGWKDGSFAEAAFNDPQGMALGDGVLYVADRKNHLIRALDLKAQMVSTIAGIGVPSEKVATVGAAIGVVAVKTIPGIGVQGSDRDSSGPALKIGLNSPWDLLLHGNRLYIAMAGHHQIWTLDLAKEALAPFAGNGREYLKDGLLRPKGFRDVNISCFAQPSGLTSDGTTLYVADSEVSAVRALPLDGKGHVRTLVGEGLFEFGDNDGVGAKVRLQHALGVAYADGKIYVADTYNSKIKVLDPKDRSCKTFLGGEPEGWFAGPTFSEPGGIHYADGKLYVADTNAHRIRVVDLKTKTVTTLTLKGVEAPKLTP